MTAERMIELNLITTIMTNIIRPAGSNERGEIYFENKTYDAKELSKRQALLFGEFMSDYEVSSDACVIEDTEKSE